MVLLFLHVSYTDSANKMSDFEDKRERHSPTTTTSLSNMPAPKFGKEAWNE